MLKRTICWLLSVCLTTGMLFSAPFSVRAEEDTAAEIAQLSETTGQATETTEKDDRPYIQPVVNQTRMSAEAIELLKSYEGFRTRPFWDVSQYSVGYGTRCPDDVYQYSVEHKDYEITKEEATYLLLVHVNSKGGELNKFIEKYKLNLNQYQYDALMLFTYNVGTGWMRQTGLLQSAVINGAKGNDFIYPFVLWCKADRVFSNGLIERRLAEANLYLNGVYGRKPPSDYRFVRFDVNGGSSDYAVQGFDVDEPVPIKVIAEKTYTASNGAVYEFEGWYDKRVGGNKVEVLDASIPYASYLYAHWKLIKEGTGSSGGNDPGGTTTLVDVVVTASSLNVRLGPGTGYSLAPSQAYPKGMQLTIIETKSGSGYLWGRVANTGDPGYWVALEYTNYYEVIQNQQPTTPPVTQPVVTPTTKPTPPPTTQPAPTPTTKPTQPQGVLGIWVGVVKLNNANSNLNIRQEPKTGSTVTGKLKNGESVTIVERVTVSGEEWGRMEKGWISLKFVSFDPVNTTPPTTQPAPTQPAPTQPAPTQPAPTQPAPTQPAPTQPAPTQPAPTEPLQTESTESVFPSGDGSWIGKVNTSFLPIRSAAGTVHAITGYYKHSDSVQISRCMTVDGQLWGKVEDGWISLTFVALDGEEIMESNGFMTVKTCSLRVRSGAGVENSIVTFLSYGEVIAVHDRQQVGSSLWGLTDYGWVDLKYLQ